MNLSPLKLSTFTAKGNQTKQISKILGTGFSVKTNGTCTFVKGDLAEAKELLAGYEMFLGVQDCGDGSYLMVWAK